VEVEKKRGNRRGTKAGLRGATGGVWELSWGEERDGEGGQRWRKRAREWHDR
jgi:hypothetical protein